MTASQIITKAKIRLILNHPFFATLALGMNYIEDVNEITASCDGENIRYNPEYVSKMQVDEVEGLLAHKVMHPALLHHTRMGERDFETWNKACDYAINPILKEAGLRLPKNILIDSRFENLPSENIYNILYEEKKKEEKKPDQPDGEPDKKPDQSGKEPGKSDKNGKNKGNPDPNAPENFGRVSKPETTKDVKQIESEMKQKVSQAESAGKKAGNISKSIEKLVAALLQPKIDWKEVLSRFLCEVSNNDYTWTKPSRRYIPMGLYLPSLENIEIGKVVFIVDTSGSCNVEILNILFSELKYAMELFKFPVTVITCNTHIQDVWEVEEDCEFNPKRGGGTDFKPPFEYIEKNMDDTRAIVYLTDGKCDSFSGDPNIPTLWATYNNPTFNPPFGEVITIEK